MISSGFKEASECFTSSLRSELPVSGVNVFTSALKTADVFGCSRNASRWTLGSEISVSHLRLYFINGQPYIWGSNTRQYSHNDPFFLSKVPEHFGDGQSAPLVIKRLANLSSRSIDIMTLVPGDIVRDQVRSVSCILFRAFESRYRPCFTHCMPGASENTVSTNVLNICKCESTLDSTLYHIAPGMLSL
jgi:hypothetical protein